MNAARCLPPLAWFRERGWDVAPVLPLLPMSEEGQGRLNSSSCWGV